MTTETLPKQIGNRLKALRLQRGWTHKYVAAKLGIKHQCQISQWETSQNGKMVSLPTLMLFADLYDVTLDYLVGRKIVDV